MKKIILFAALFASLTAFADTGTATLATQSAEGSAVSQAQSAAGANSSASSSGNLNNNCIGTCYDQTASTKIASDTAIAIAATNARAALDIASTTQVIKNTPSVQGPNLTTSNDTCMGSTSGSVNIAGLGIGGGSSWVDDNCKMLKNSRELWNMGMKAASLALMCTDKANMEALELTGFLCPQTAAKVKAADANSPAKVSAANQYTDPIVRTRLGLVPLTVAAK